MSSWAERLIQSNLPQPLRRTDAPKAAGTAAARVGVQGRPDYPDVGIDNLQRAFSRNEIVFAALRAKATAAKDPRLVVQARTSDVAEWQEVQGHPLKRILMRPNDRMDGAQFMQAAVVSWDTCRKFYCQKLYVGDNRKTGALNGLNPLNPALLKLQRDGTYRWGSGKDVRTFEPDELLIREAPAWFDPPPMVVCLGSVDADSAQTDYIRAFFNNGGVPAGVLTSDQELKPDQADEIRERWRTKFTRFLGRQHDIAVLGRGARYERMGANLNELQGDSLREFVETRVAMTFEVPPLIIYAYAGLRRATYANLKEARAGWWDNQLTPMFKDWLSFFTWHLLTEFEDEERIYSERVRLTYDMREVAALQEDVDAAHRRAKEAWQTGGISRAEYRAKIGEQAAPEDDFYILPLSVQTVAVGAVVVDAEPTDAAAKQRAARTLATKALKVASTATIEQRIERETKKLLGTVFERVADAVREQEEETA